MIRYLFILFLLTGTAFADSTPEGTARRLFQWAKKSDLKFQKHLPEIRSAFSDELYRQLARAYTWQSPHEFLDFDPFSNSQMGASAYQVGRASVSGSQAKVPITVLIDGGGKTRYTCVLTQKNGDWRVSNFVYQGFDLMTQLRAINK